jgi:hypothetical protein
MAAMASTKGNARLGSQRRATLSRSDGSGASVNENLWQVYSPKSDRDWLLHSDLSLVYWLTCLETQPDVREYELRPDISVPSVAAKLTPARPEAIVLFQSGHTEWHYIRRYHYGQEEVATIQEEIRKFASCSTLELKIFSEDQLRQSSALAVNWLSAISHAACIRGEHHHHIETALVSYIHHQGRGTVKDFLDGLADYDAAIVLGVIIRLAISGAMELDLRNRPFSYLSGWRSYANA